MRKSLFVILIVLIATISFSTAAVVSADPTIQTITVKGLQVCDVKVTPNGQIAAAYIGPTARLMLNIPSIGYAPDPNLLPIRLIDLATGQEIGQLIGPTDYVGDVAFSPNGKQMASYHMNGDIYLWDMTTKRSIKHISSFGASRANLAFSPNGNLLFADLEMGFIGYFVQYDLNTGYILKIGRRPLKSAGEIGTTTPDNMDNGFAAFDMSHDGKLLATASMTGEISLWDTTTFQQTVLKAALEDRDEKIHALLSIRRINFSADGKLVIYFDEIAKQTHIWDVAARTEQKVLSIGSSAWSMSPQGDMLVWVAQHKELWLASIAQPDQGVKLMDFSAPLLASPFLTLTFSPNGKHIVVGGFYSQDKSQDSVIYVVTLK